jgi:hypothetical protein
MNVRGQTTKSADSAGLSPAGVLSSAEACMHAVCDYPQQQESDMANTQAPSLLRLGGAPVLTPVLIMVLTLALAPTALLASDPITGAAMDGMKEKAVDSAVDKAAGMAKDQAKSAMGMDDAASVDDVAAEDAAEAAETEAEAQE